MDYTYEIPGNVKQTLVAALKANGFTKMSDVIAMCQINFIDVGYRIMFDGRKVGGVVLNIDKKTHRNHLDLLFVSPDAHGKGIGYGAWQAVEALHPETEVWETCTPYFEKRNIHFYINKCGFHAVEFFGEFHPDPDEPDDGNSEGPSEMFRFVKVMK